MIYLTGYGMSESSDGLAALAEKRNALLVDIRFAPQSRFPDWRQAALQTRFGAQYVHLPEWGNSTRKQGKVTIVDYACGLERLRALPGDKICFCGCWHEANCHRAEIKSLLEIDHVMVKSLPYPLPPKPEGVWWDRQAGKERRDYLAQWEAWAEKHPAQMTEEKQQEIARVRWQYACAEKSLLSYLADGREIDTGELDAFAAEHWMDGATVEEVLGRLLRRGVVVFDCVGNDWPGDVRHYWYRLRRSDEARRRRRADEADESDAADGRGAVQHEWDFSAGGGDAPDALSAIFPDESEI